MTAAALRGVVGVSVLLPALLLLATGRPVESGGDRGCSANPKWNAAFDYASRGLVRELRLELRQPGLLWLFGMNSKSAVDVDAQSEACEGGDTLLHAAVRKRHLKIVELLVSDKHSANVNLPNARKKGEQVRCSHPPPPATA